MGEDDWDGIMLYCRAESFRPQQARVEAEVRWLDWDADFDLARRCGWHEPPPLSREEWEQARREHFRYAAAIVDGRIVSMAAEWRRAEDEWEVAAVGTHPDWRRRGLARAVVSFVTAAILAVGRRASIGTREHNAAMIRTAESVGYTLRALSGNSHV